MIKIPNLAEEVYTMYILSYMSVEGGRISNIKLPLMDCLLINNFYGHSKLWSDTYYRFVGSKQSGDAPFARILLSNIVNVRLELMK